MSWVRGWHCTWKWISNRPELDVNVQISKMEDWSQLNLSRSPSSNGVWQSILSPGHTAHDNDTKKIVGHTGTIRSSVTTNMNLTGERFFWYRCRVQCDWSFTQISPNMNAKCSMLDHVSPLNFIFSKPPDVKNMLHYQIFNIWRFWERNCRNVCIY